MMHTRHADISSALGAMRQQHISLPTPPNSVVASVQPKLLVAPAPPPNPDDQSSKKRKRPAGEDGGEHALLALIGAVVDRFRREQTPVGTELVQGAYRVTWRQRMNEDGSPTTRGDLAIVCPDNDRVRSMEKLRAKLLGDDSSEGGDAAKAADGASGKAAGSASGGGRSKAAGADGASGKASAPKAGSKRAHPSTASDGDVAAPPLPAKASAEAVERAKAAGRASAQAAGRAAAEEAQKQLLAFRAGLQSRGRPVVLVGDSIAQELAMHLREAVGLDEDEARRRATHAHAPIAC